MATGRLAVADLTAATNTAVYTVPASKTASFTLSICNRSTSPVLVRVALSTSGTPAGADYIEYGATVQPGGVLERTGLVLAATQVVNVYSSAANVSAVAYGFEE